MNKLNVKKKIEVPIKLIIKAKYYIELIIERINFTIN